MAHKGGAGLAAKGAIDLFGGRGGRDRIRRGKHRGLGWMVRGGDCACHQGARARILWGTLMRHFLRRSPLATAVGGLAPGVRTAPPRALLVAPPRLPNLASPCRLAAAPRAVALPPVTPGADVDPKLTAVTAISSTVRPHHHAAQVVWTPAAQPAILAVPGGRKPQGHLAGDGVFAKADVPRVLSLRNSPSHLSDFTPGTRARARR